MSVAVLVLMGSHNDWEIMQETGKTLDALGVSWDAHVTSAHRSPERTVELVRKGEADGVRVFICGAGMAAHLAGVVAAHTVRPVIGVPLPGGVADGLDALLSTVQMPAGVPVATVAVGKSGARNAALLATEILAVSDSSLTARLMALRAESAAAIAEADGRLTVQGAGR